MEVTYKMFKYLRALVIVTLLVINLVILSTIFCYFAILKTIIPTNKLKIHIYHITEQCYHIWVDVNAKVLTTFTPTKWNINSTNKLSKDDWYALIANHFSGVDILALQILLNRKVPHLKFFMKDSLKWIPIIGQFCYFFNYPFIKRYTPQQIRKKPKRKYENISNLKDACGKLKSHPTTIINFLEGTRFTTTKHALQKSPYKNLLQPQVGGTSVLLTEMQQEIKVIIDATINYKGGKTLVDLLLGQIETVNIDIALISVDPSWHGNFYEDTSYKRSITGKFKNIWEKKDALISEI